MKAKRDQKCRHADEVRQYRLEQGRNIAIQIRELYAAGVPQEELARQFSVNIRKIKLLVSGPKRKEG